MVGVAQLVRAPDCGSGGRGFETRHSPHSERAMPLLNEGPWYGRLVTTLGIVDEAVVPMHFVTAAFLNSQGPVVYTMSAEC